MVKPDPYINELLFDHDCVIVTDLGGFIANYRPASINPALHRNVEYFIDLEPAERASPAPLMITRASEDGETFRAALDRWLEHWQSAQSDALDLSVKPLEGQHHASSAPAAYRAALAWWAADKPTQCAESAR